MASVRNCLRTGSASKRSASSHFFFFPQRPARSQLRHSLHVIFWGLSLRFRPFRPRPGCGDWKVPGEHRLFIGLREWLSSIQPRPPVCCRRRNICRGPGSSPRSSLRLLPSTRPRLCARVEVPHTPSPPRKASASSGFFFFTSAWNITAADDEDRIL